jgi:hypothetical protein
MPATFEALRERLRLDEAGRLVLNGQEMILLPRHFFRYILREVRHAVGPENFRRVFRKAGHDGAVTFCRRYREAHGCGPREAVEGYFREMSLRGWGRFSVLRLDPEAGAAEVLLESSAVPEEGELPAGHVTWEGAVVGALRFLNESLPEDLRSRSEESAGRCRLIVGRD